MEINKQNDEIEIDLRQIFRLLLQKAVIIIISGIIVALIALLFSKLFMKPQYESSTKLYVINRQSNQGTTTYSDLQSATQLTKDYKILITSRTVTEQVVSELNLDISADKLAKKITVSTPTDTRILEINVEDGDQYKAKEIADKVAEIASDSIRKVMQVEQVNIVESANFPSEPSSPNVKRNTVIGGLIGLIAAAAAVIVKFLLNDTIRSAEDIERFLGISTLALIPLTDEMYDGEGSKGRKRKKKKRSKK